MATTYADHGTLVANTVTTVTLTAAGKKRRLRVQNRGTSGSIYYRFGITSPTDPTVAGDDTFGLPPGATDEWDLDVLGWSPDDIGQSLRYVKLISSATPEFSVEAW